MVSETNEGGVEWLVVGLVVVGRKTAQSQGGWEAGGPFRLATAT